MQRRDVTFLLGALPLAAGLIRSASAEGSMREEAHEHPRIARAIHEIEDAVHYMEEAPHDFGGHKREAIEACRHAAMELRRALAFRAHRD